MTTNQVCKLKFEFQTIQPGSLPNYCEILLLMTCFRTITIKTYFHTNDLLQESSKGEIRVSKESKLDEIGCRNNLEKSIRVSRKLSQKCGII